MSFLGSKADSIKYAEEASKTPDRESMTSPIRDGGGTGSSNGGAPITGPTEFSHERTRMKQVGNTGGVRREFPSEGVPKKPA